MVAIGLTGVAILGLFATQARESRLHVAPRHVPDTAAVRLVKQADAWAIKRDASSCDSAIATYSEATYRDSLYARAYGGLAQARALCALFGTGNPKEQFVAAKGASETALRLDSTLAVAYTARGMVQLFAEQNFLGAQRDFLAAIRFDSAQYQPWLYRTWSYFGTGDLDSALASIRRAYSLDPVQPIVGVRLATVLRYHGDTAEAEQRLAEVLHRDTSNVLAHGERLELYDATNQCDKALKEIRWVAHDPHMYYRALAAFAWASCGHKERARQFADSIEKRGGYVSSFSLAMVYAALGDSAKVFQLLNQSITDHEGLLFFLGKHFAFQKYHGSPAFRELLKRARVKGWLRPP